MRSIPIPTTGDIIAGKYRLDETLGRGGFGIVFKATHLEMSRPVALKTLLPQVATLPTAAERFRREAVLASSLTHPNSITLFDYGQTPDGVLYLVMELLRGKTLSKVMVPGEPMKDERATAVCVQVLKSLAEAHALGIVHLDMKPGNIFLCDVPGERDFVKVLDFGVARMFAAHNAAQNLSESLAMGTPRYMAPEQITGEDVGPQTDLYALGLIGYELLMGQPAFTGRTPLEIVARQLNQPVPRLPEGLRRTPLGQMVDRATQKLPQDRFARAAEALELLHQPSEAYDVMQGGAASQDEGQDTHLTSVLDEDEAEAGATHVHRDLDLLGESQWPEADLGIFQQEMDGAATVVRSLRDSDSSSLLSDSPLVDGDDDEMDNARTRVRDGFEEQPTQAVAVYDADDLVELVEGTTQLDLGDLEESLEDDLVDPEPTPEAERTEEYGRNVFFSVGAEAGYMGAAHNVPGQEAHPGQERQPGEPVLVSLKEAQEEDELDAPPQTNHGVKPAPEQGRSAMPLLTPSTPSLSAMPPRDPRDSGLVRTTASPQHPASQSGQRRAAPAPDPAPAPAAKLDKGVVVALGLLGAGMVLTLTVVLGVILVAMMTRSEGGSQAELAVAEPKVAQAVEPPAQPPQGGAGGGAAAAQEEKREEKVEEKVEEKKEVADQAPKADPVEEAGAQEPQAGARLNFTSEPKTAQVFVKGQFVGTTPLVLPQESREGDTEVVFKLDGYLEETVRVSYEGDKSLHILMRQKPAPTPVVRRATPGEGSAQPPSPPAPKSAPRVDPPKKAPKKKVDPMGKW